VGIQSENWVQRHQITVDQYYQMAQVGLLSAEDRVELIEGEIIDMAPIGSAHASTLRTLAELFREAVGKQAIVAVQDPVRLGDRSEPEPDLALLRRREDRYKHAHPTAPDVYLIVEVAQTSLRYDREIKLPLYARHGIPEVWIIDTQKRTLSLHRDPQGERYASESTTSAPGKLALSALPDVAIDLAGLFD
jgi:Uma2 family endonuclease